MRPRTKLHALLHQRQGPLSRELTLSPGRFGLGRVPERLAPDGIATAVCGYCSTGCGLNVHLQGGQAVNISPTTSYPVNLGMACPKGWESLAPLTADNRATTPLLKDGSGKQSPVGWHRAMQTFVKRFQAIQAKHGPESVAFLSTGQIPSEEMALLGALCKFGMGMRHGDGNTRQCMATAVVAYKQSFGFDAPPYSYRDFEESDVIVLWGSNLCIAHPILWERISKNRHQPEIIVVDPRKTETAAAATFHLALQPKSDLELLYGIARILIERDAIDDVYIDAHTTGFDAFRRHVQHYDLQRVAEVSGLSEATILQCAQKIQDGKRVSFWWTMGVNQSHQGVRTAQAIINLALMTGNMGRPGTGANSITGQCNAMGSRLFSNTTNLLGGHDFANPAHRAKVAATLNIREEVIPQDAGLAYDQILEEILKGSIKGLWLIGTNTAHSWINQLDVAKLFAKLDFFVVQDIYHDTETAKLADLILPAAGWGEKEGTFINSERRIGRIKRVCHSPGQSLADFYIFRLVAEYWGCREMFRNWKSPEQVFKILKSLSRDQPCDITGIKDYAMLDHLGGLQWPYPAGSANTESERRLFEDGKFYTQNGKAKFIFENSKPVPEQTSKRFPFTLLTGRGSSCQWHTQTRTRNAPVLRKLYPNQIYVEINRRDAKRLDIAAQSWVRISSPRGSLTARAFPTEKVRPGQVFVPMHYAATNQLTFPAFDPYSRQPSYKACAVDIQKLATWEVDERLAAASAK